MNTQQHFLHNRIYHKSLYSMWENDVPHFKKTKSTTVIGKALAKS